MKQLLILILSVLLIVNGNRAGAADKTVAAELFTTTWCPSCPTAEEAITKLTKEKGPSKLFFIAWHPTSDEFGNDKLDDYIENVNHVHGIPTICFDGISSVVGTRWGLAGTYTNLYQTRAAKTTGVTIELSGESFDTTLKIRARISVEKKSTIPGNNILFALYEIKAQGKKKIFFNVVRDYQFYSLNIRPGETKTVPITFILPQGANPYNFGVAVLLKNSTTNEILNSGVISFFDN